MNNTNNNSTVNKDQLMEIIKILTEVVQQGLDLEGVMFLVTRHAMKLTNADGAVIELAEGEAMVYRATSGVAENQLGLRIKIEKSLSGLTYKLSSPFICYDSEHDPRVDRQACRKIGLKSMAIVPLKHLDTPVGVLKVMSSKVNMFDETSLDLLNLMSNVIASSMFNASKYESDELFYRATYDSLTDVANRSLFYDRLRQRIAQAERLSENFGIIYLDVDALKHINDTLGHRAGDCVLIEIAQRIDKVIREIDTVARIGGDEFAILVYDIDQADDAYKLMDRINQSIQEPFLFCQYKVPLSVSMGFALYSDNSSDIEAMMKIADQNMYCNKLEHRSRDLTITSIND